MTRPTGHITLAIETSNPSSAGSDWTAVAVGRSTGSGVEVLASVPLRPGDRHDDALMPAIEEACRDAGIGPSDLARVAVSVGPGGFTALRIAVTTAKLLALTRSCACIAVPTAAALALRCPESHFQRGPVAIALAWKRDTVWIERFESPTRCLSSRLEHTDRLDLTGCSALIADPRFVDALDATLRHASLAIQHPQFDAVAVLEASMSIEPTDPLALAPFYPREPEAVTKWRELHG